MQNVFRNYVYYGTYQFPDKSRYVKLLFLLIPYVTSAIAVFSYDIQPLLSGVRSKPLK